MTGHGRGEASQRGYKIVVELTSVNRRQSEISVSLPRAIEALESRIRDEVNRRIARGRMNVKVTWHAGDAGVAPVPRLNVALARAYAEELARLARQLELNEMVTLDLLLKVPGVLETDEESPDAESFWPALGKALDEALTALVRMREREGQHLARDLKARVAFIRKAATRIRKEAPAMVERYREQLRERIRAAGLETPAPDDERLVREVVYFADRSDISEELTRLESHFKQFEELLRSTEPVGRTLDFLAQEINREINTIGSKSADGGISREVVAVKAELEKFREQVQNVE